MNVKAMIQTHPRRWLLMVALVPLVLLLFGLYLQHVVGLVPCPMCIVQRYALVLVMVCAALAASRSPVRWQLFWVVAWVLFGLFGAYVAARQSWLQWYPPEVVSCGRDFYGMIETFPLQRAIPMIFRGGGDCSQIDWTLLGGSIANWSFIAFVGLSVLGVCTLWWRWTSRQA
ncbi:DsbB Disulfide bond formation protein DsbB [Burkholderiaceae bacterium]